MTTTQDDYLLGASDAELDRLDRQAALLRPATLDAMRAAGIGPGMRVLDLGSGTGAVAFDAARLVGPTGSVLGLDAGEVAVRTATANAARLGLAHVRFERSTLDEWPPAGEFDAVTGRLIGMYLPDPAATLARLATRLRPGGVALLMEFSISSMRQVPAGPLATRMHELVLAAFRSAGIPTDLGWDLGRVLRAAGFAEPTVSIGGRWEDGPDAATYPLLTEIVRTLAPRMEAAGLADPAALGLDTLTDRLRAEARALGAGVHYPLLVSAWARRPG